MKPLTQRPQVSQDVINIFSYLVDKQDRKGWQKYNSTIDDASDDMYDWLEMALEEAVDGMKYLVKENIRLRKELYQARLEIKMHEERRLDIPQREQPGVEGFTVFGRTNKPKYAELDDE